MTCLSLAKAIDSQLAIIGERGDLCVFSESGGRKQIAPVNMLNRTEGFVGDAYCAPQDNRVYFATENGRLFEIDLSNLTNGCQQICVSNEVVLDVWHNKNERRPAWLKLGEKNTPSSIQFSGKDGQIHTARPDDIEFRGNQIFCMHIDGTKSSNELAARNSDLIQIAATYAKDEWMILGRSEQIAVYGLMLADSVKDGEPFNDTHLYHDRVRNKWRIQKFDEYADVFIFDHVAIIQGSHDVKGSTEQSKPTGNWYFYSPKHPELAKYKFDPSWTVPYASAEYAIVVGGGKLMRLPLWKPGVVEPEVLAELPQNFVVAAVCPVLEDAENTEGAFQGQP